MPKKGRKAGNNTLKTITQEQLELAQEKVAKIDLNPIKFKLMDAEAEGWSREFVDQVEEEYRRFLVLNILFPEEPIVCSTTVDKFWHQHILDTMKYPEDCEQLFGYFLHHFPYFGMRGESDAQNLQSSFEATKLIYKATFKAQMPEVIAADCNTCGAGSCAGDGSPGSSCSGRAPTTKTEVLMTDIRPTLN